MSPWFANGALWPRGGCVAQLAEEVGAPVTEQGHEMAELVTGIRLRERVPGRRHRVAREEREGVRFAQPRGVEGQLIGEVVVDEDEPGIGHRDGVGVDVQALNLTRIGVLEAPVHRVSLPDGRP